MKQQLKYAVLTLLICSLQAKIMRNNALMSKMVSHFQQDNNLSIEPPKGDKQHHQHHNHEKQVNNEQEWQETPNRQETQSRQETPIKQETQVTQERDDKEDRQEKTINSPRRSDKVVNLMQNVLCRNFPMIPCEYIMHDEALSKLIQRSIQQIANKKQRNDSKQPISIKMSTGFNPIQRKFPLINSEDLSNFLEVSNTGYFNEPENKLNTKKKKRSGLERTKNHWSHEKPSKRKLKGKKDAKRGTQLLSGRKKMRKFYPHKVKYKDKKSKLSGRAIFGEDPEKVSMSAEMPDIGMAGVTPNNKDRLSYKLEQSDSPVWRIDYMKHGVPSMNLFEYSNDQRLRGKLMRTIPNVAHEDDFEDNVVRKEVLHPDVYIKKNNFFRNPNVNSDILE